MHSTQKAFGLVEAVISISIIAAFIVTMSSVNALYATTSLQNDSRIQSAFLTEEGIEAVRFMRDSSWSTNIEPLSNNTEYYLSFDGSAWEATTTPISPLGFTRTIMFETVNRDGNADITSSGGTLDINTKQLTVRTSWDEKGVTKEKVIKTYITNLFAN